MGNLWLGLVIFKGGGREEDKGIRVSKKRGYGGNKKID